MSRTTAGRPRSRGQAVPARRVADRHRRAVRAAVSGAHARGVPRAAARAAPRSRRWRGSCPLFLARHPEALPRLPANLPVAAPARRATPRARTTRSTRSRSSTPQGGFALRPLHAVARRAATCGSARARPSAAAATTCRRRSAGASPKGRSASRSSCRSPHPATTSTIPRVAWPKRAPARPRRDARDHRSRDRARDRRRRARVRSHARRRRDRALERSGAALPPRRVLGLGRAQDRRADGRRRMDAGDIPDQTGRVAVVTGANSGLGLGRPRGSWRGPVRASCWPAATSAKGERAGSEIRAAAPAASGSRCASSTSPTWPRFARSRRGSPAERPDSTC